MIDAMFLPEDSLDALLSHGGPSSNSPCCSLAFFRNYDAMRVALMDGRFLRARDMDLSFAFGVPAGPPSWPRCHPPRKLPQVAIVVEGNRDDSVMDSTCPTVKSMTTPSTSSSYSPRESSLKQPCAFPEQQKISFRVQSASSSARGHHSKELWEIHKPTIQYMYLIEGKPLREVKQFMAERHGFQATDKMYKSRFSRWAFEKNTTKDLAKRILHAKMQRDAVGKRSEFYLHDRKIDLARYLRRKGVTELDLVDLGTSDTALPENIRCCTPAPLDEPRYLKAPNVVRIQDAFLRSLSRVFEYWRQNQPSMKTATGSSLLQRRSWLRLPHRLRDASEFFSSGHHTLGFAALRRAYHELNRYLRTLHPLQTLNLLFRTRQWASPGMTLQLWRYIAAYSRSGSRANPHHPLYQTFTLFDSVLQRDGLPGAAALTRAVFEPTGDLLESVLGPSHFLALEFRTNLSRYNIPSSSLNGKTAASQPRLEAAISRLRTALRTAERLSSPNHRYRPPERVVIELRLWYVRALALVGRAESDEAAALTRRTYDRLSGLRDSGDRSGKATSSLEMDCVWMLARLHRRRAHAASVAARPARAVAAGDAKAVGTVGPSHMDLARHYMAEYVRCRVARHGQDDTFAIAEMRRLEQLYEEASDGARVREVRAWRDKCEGSLLGGGNSTCASFP